jgi:hypothetical protein
MILVSQGFVYDVQLKQMKDVTLASRRHNVPIYFVDTRGLQGLPDAFTAAFGRPIEVQDTVAVLADLTREAEGTEALALDTGGFVVKNSNDLSGGMTRVSSESRAYYLLGYNPTDLRRDGKFRRIQVKLSGTKGRGLTVRARGCRAPRGRRSRARRKRDPAIGHALDSPFEISDVPLRVSSFVFDEVALDQMSVQLAVEIDVSDVDYRQEADRSTGALAFLIEAQHRESGEYYRYDQKIELSLLPETRRKLEQTGYSVAREFTLPSGGYQAKVVVRDLNSGKVGSSCTVRSCGHPARVDAGPERHAGPGHGRDAASRPAGAARLRDGRDAVLPVRGLRGSEGRGGVAHAPGLGRVRDPPCGRGGLQAHQPHAHQPDLGRGAPAPQRHRAPRRPAGRVRDRPHGEGRARRPYGRGEGAVRNSRRVAKHSLAQAQPERRRRRATRQRSPTGSPRVPSRSLVRPPDGAALG